MNTVKLTNREQQILDLIKLGYCLPREIAHELKANKSNVSTVLKTLLDQGLVVREKLFGTYVYALNNDMLNDLLSKKASKYQKQMSLERRMFCKR